MSGYERILAGLTALCAVLAIALPLGVRGDTIIASWTETPALVFPVLVLVLLGLFVLKLPPLASGVLALAGGAIVILELGSFDRGSWGYWFLLATVWLLAWLFAERLSTRLARAPVRNRLAGTLIPVMFGAAILLVWEAVTRGGGVPNVILPAPSNVWNVLTGSVPTLAVDFVQTFKAVLAGYALGCGVGFAVAIAIDRSPFLKRGLLPLGNFVSALPLIGIAPIMVMWFGYDWPSKAAVVVIMTFFPMLVNTIAGLTASGAMERDMMRTYASGYWQTLFKLRLPAAAPFIFNALKINSTLALIGAIVAEFFGTPIVGMGFRISTEIGKLNVQMVWAEIAVAALAGSVFYWVVALIERAVTFWHPSVRGGRA
ncbi:MAG: ABC transporter permease [Devosia nanyangense]|uniref:ABC transporter permease n=1 Tax=Devosia nanyangense TaxID=1228055 RepID=A0A933NVM3_9HYPH|nr:ABC transporter permease [Devosia nanyangense]